MKNFRSLIDITPWDKGGYSFLGLKRREAKALAMVFIVVGTLLAVPPIVPDPMDVVAFGISMYMEANYDIPIETTLLLLYTVVAWFIILVGIWIYPANTKAMFNGYIRKAKRGIRKILSDPLLIGLSGGVLYVLFKWYKSNVDLSTVQTDISGLTALIIQPNEITVFFVLALVIIMLILKNRK